MAQSKKNGKTNRGKTAKQKRMPQYEADSLAAYLIIGILLLATGILTLLGAGFGLQHEVFRYLRQFSSSMFGSMTLLMTFALIAAGVALLISTTRKVSRRYVVSYAILVVLLSGFVSLMTFVLLYPPCAAASASIIKGLKSRKLSLLMLAGQFLLAWICAYLVYQLAIV